MRIWEGILDLNRDTEEEIEATDCSYTLSRAAAELYDLLSLPYVLRSSCLLQRLSHRSYDPNLLS